MPRLKEIPFETAVIERCRRRESSVEEALIEMDLTEVSVGLRISQRHSEELRSLREQSANGIRRPMPALKYGEVAL